jgi:hypothetical protein
MGLWQGYKNWVAGNFRLMGHALGATTGSFLARAFVLALQITVGMLYLTIGLIAFFLLLVIGIIRGEKQGGNGEETNDKC